MFILSLQWKIAVITVQCLRHMIRPDHFTMEIIHVIFCIITRHADIHVMLTFRLITESVERSLMASERISGIEKYIN